MLVIWVSRFGASHGSVTKKPGLAPNRLIFATPILNRDVALVQIAVVVFIAFIHFVSFVVRVQRIVR